jgi:calcium/calmodulin-dependent protein kinase (CaM kinase) II
MNDGTADELIALNHRLLRAIMERDYQTYVELCDPTLTAFEPEAAGHLVEGLAFHAFYFVGKPARFEVTMASPHVRVMADVAVVAYVRLNQMEMTDGSFATVAVEETRVWQRQGGRWRHVHFHRSRPSPSAVSG